MKRKLHLNLSTVMAISLLSSLLLATANAGVFCSCPKQQGKANGSNVKRRQQQCQPNGAYQQYKRQRKHMKIAAAKQSESNVRQSNCTPEMCKKPEACPAPCERVKNIKQKKCRRQRCPMSKDCLKEVKSNEDESNSTETK